MLSALLLSADLQAQRMPPCDPPGTVASETGQRTVEAAQRAQQREAAVFDEAVRRSVERVNQATNCLSEVTRAVNEQIPNFGGGILGSLTSVLTQNLANQACSAAGQAQQQVPGNLPGGLPGGALPPMESVLRGTPLPAGVQIPGAPAPAAPAAPGGAVQSVGGLLSGLF